MNEITEAEKVVIEPEKIIRILLKHLMYLKNEIAYIQNKADLQLEGNGIVENMVGIKSAPDVIPENLVGIKPAPNVIPESMAGIKSAADVTPENMVGIKSAPDVIPENMVGVKSASEGIPENMLGIKSKIKGISTLNMDTNGGVLLYSVFEQGLIDALDRYIKNGNKQNSLYAFYENFIAAIKQKNEDVIKTKHSIMNLSLEQTHKMPANISLDNASIARLKTALYGVLPKTGNDKMYITVALELAMLHNTGKCSGTRLRNAGGLSVSGFAKHLPKLKSYGLIKKQPPNNYVLTETSKYILLKTFGIPKNQ